MAKRSLETLTDVLVLIVSPVLVMILVGSLSFFVIQCFYNGQYFERLNFATGLFVMAAVLVARIAIEDGREYASTFAVPLGLVTILSMLQYTDLGALVAVPLVLFIWWSTDKLTWDCTVLEEDKDASGEGLLQTIGLDEKAGDAAQDAMTDREQTEKTSFWKRWIEQRKRHHTPGVWVIYFGLAAIPLFGIGQSVLSEASRGAGFLLLCIYVAAALALLMITSFLQMRRYLLQRRLPFTEKMAAVWLGTGGTMIIVLMVLGLLLPRPNTGYSLVDSLAESIEAASSRDRKASEWAFGKEGTLDEDRAGQGESDQEEAATDSEQGRQSSTDAQQGSQSGRQGQGNDRDGRQTSQSEQGKQAGQDRSNRRRSENAQQDRSDDRGSGENAENSSEARSEQNSSGDRGSEGEEDGDAAANRESQARREQEDGGNSETNESSSGPSDSSFQPPNFSNPLENLSLPSIPKLLYVLLIAIGVLLLLFFYGRQIFAAIQAFLRDLSSFFGGRRPDPTPEVAEPIAVPPPKPFGAFKDPFASGLAAQWTSQQLVAYTFEALQAWAFEQQCPRREDQTPLEFAGALSRSNQAIGQYARNLAVLYNQAAYAPEHVRHQFPGACPGNLEGTT